LSFKSDVFTFSQLAEAQQRANVSQQRVAELEMEVKSLNSLIASLTTSEASTRSQVAALQQETDKSNATIVQLQKDKAALQADLEKARTAAASAAAVDNSGTSLPVNAIACAALT
jgi:septal ring factor EnvC (AmiA/AmiB activator)